MASRGGFAHRFADTLFALPKLWLTLGLIVTLGLGYFVKDLRIDNSVEVLFQSDSPVVRAYRTFTQVFGNAELAVIAFRDEAGIFRPEVLQEIAELTQRIESEVAHVDQVISLTNTNIIDADPAGGMIVRPLVPDAATTDAVTLAAIEARAHHEPFLEKTLISSDGKTTSIVVKTQYLENNQTYRAELTGDLRKLLAEYSDRYDTQYFLGGPPIFLTYFDEYILKDLLIFGPVIFFVLASILYLTFRSLTGVVVPMTIVAVGAIWTVGFMGLMGFPITLATTIIPPLLFVMGIEDAVYVLSFFQREAEKFKDAQKRAWATSLHTNVACLLTSVTTAIGFGSLMITDINAVFETGLVSAFGTMALWITNNAMLPLILRHVRYNAKDKARADAIDHGLLLRFLDKTLDLNLAHPWAVLAVGLSFAAAFVPGVPQLKVETNFVKYFHEESPIFIAQQFIQKNLSGVAPLEILVDTGSEDGANDPQVLREMAAITETLRNDPVVDWAFGTQDFYTVMHGYMSTTTVATGTASGFTITDPALVAQYRMLYDGSAGLENFLTDDGRYARVSARLQDQSTSVLKHTLANVARHFESPKSGATYQFADNTAMIVGIVDAMLINTGQSLLIATVVIWLLIAVYVRSLRISLLFMVPNLIPVVCVLGLMGYTGIELNISTMMIGAVAIGLAVNNTIHVFAHFPRALAHFNGRLEKAAHETMHTVGRAAFAAGGSLMLGFSVLALSNFYPNLYFGTLSAFTVLVALICDVTISFTIWILLGKHGYRGPAHMQHD